MYQNDDENDFTPSEISDISLAYMSKNDFLNWKNSRVQILFVNEKKYNDYYYMYVDFDDIHLIRPDFYVLENLYLTQINADTLKIINNMYDKTHDLVYNHGKDSKFKHKNVFALMKKNKIQKVLTYVSYAYSKFIIKQTNDFFFMSKNQIYTAYEACKICLNLSDQNTKDISRGVVFQVETGEGKSCIVCLIASLLALMKKTVHIASSNITLANRDYHDSFLFFQQLGLKSAVLLHYNELPFNVRLNGNSDKNSNNGYFYNPNFYPKEFYKKKLFKNSAGLNYSVCGINDNNELVNNKANVVFSTFVNFESLYLRMMEMCPGYIDKYFKSCSLLIDEADSILIDELTNGTILSRSLKTNGEEILKFVYKSRIANKSAEEVCNYVKEKWPICIKYMFNQIDLVNQNEFQDGKKYCIETVKIKEKKKSLLQNAKEIFKTKIKDDKQQNEKIKNYKQIVPFDYDHKGILEPNKEFSGFVHQFIAIKEMMNNKDNENMIIKNVSMNYLYVSHPIFISLYNKVCGLTGTIGSKFEKKIFKEQYNLKTKTIPRENPNFRVEYPPILCNDLDERNKKIVLEIIEVQKKENPILVIFRDLNEIKDVFHLLSSCGIKNINIFDGKDEIIKPDRIAGLKGAVSLGTNVCGRGTDIKNPYKPLHVIVTYFSSNSRVISQAFGRTARQGNKGSVRIICLLSQFISPVYIYNGDEMKNTLNDFSFKNYLQISFIEKYREKRKWIFSNGIKTQIFHPNDIEIMRSARININRIIICNFEFPICMSIPTFLNIQAQKIFSLFNCPNCKYTWMLFQKYIREMILEAWSLFIEQSEKKYSENNIQMRYNDFLQKECESLCSLINLYLPDSNNPIDYDIVPTFMHIFKLILSKYQNQILDIFPNELTNFLRQDGKKRFCSFTFGFKPYSLIDESGSRINILDGDNQGEQTYIKDPELKYMQKMPNHCYSIISITNKIDGIFNMICKKINEVIGSYIGLKFFLRRTLAGCEFGVCYDFKIDDIHNEIFYDKTCLVDKDPLFVFTISVKSMIPVLAGILIIGLVYISNVAESIFE